MTAPSPPGDLASRPPEFVVLDPGVIVERFYGRTNDPIYFDRSRSGRMNAPDGSYGVLYVAAEIRGAFAETFVRKPGQTLLRLDQVRKKSRVRLRVTRSVKLVRLAGVRSGKAWRDCGSDARWFALRRAAKLVQGNPPTPRPTRRHRLSCSTR